MFWVTGSAFRTGERMPEAVILEGHDGSPNSYESLVWDVKFNPAGDLLASASGDGTVRVWDVLRRKLLASFKSHPNGATSIAFHPHGHILASGGLDGTVKLWGIRNEN
jgi:WD40 repeat protein